MNYGKLAIPVLSLLLILIGYQLYSSNRLQHQQLSDYQAHVARLQGELQSHGEEQVAYETRINQLQRESRDQQSRIASLEADLAEAQDRIDPDVAALEQDIRERVLVEVRAQTQRTASRLNLVKELSSLEPMEMAQLMTLQGQYGRFLQSLNVDDARLEVITDALMNQIAEQNQRRLEVMQARNSVNPGDIASLRQQMIDITSPEAQREALSYVFTDEEMALFETFQQSQQGSFGISTRALIADPNGGGNAVFIGGDASLPVDGGRLRTLQLISPDGQISGSRVEIDN
jgi:peptidoglycan hydrolase CwlO-like protein